jgi:dihydroorotate dehydrogenase (NAD+) catalytic subunit
LTGVVNFRPVSLPARAERPETVDLSVTIGTLRLSNPIIAASGTFGYGVEFAGIVDLNRLGGLVVKGLSLEPMAGAPSPRLCETTSGMVNAVGLQNIGVRAFVSQKLPALRRYRTVIAANVFGHKVKDYVEVISVLEDAEGVGSYELNISCPNVERGSAEFSSDPRLTSEVVSAARKAARRPIWVKLAPNLNDIKWFARSAEEAGADALTVANTYPALCVDFRTRKAVLGNKTGGLSGPAIKPITLRLVYEASQTVQIPVIGLGGIGRPEDALEYIIAGAAAVQVGTAHFVDPRASERLVEGLENLCKSNKIYSLRNLRGSLAAESR